MENQPTTTLTTQHIIHDHMMYHELESSNLTITTKFLSHVKQACSRYFNDPKERCLQRVQSGRDVKMKQINYYIDDANRNRQINSLETSADEYAFEAEEKSTITEINNLISKSSALTRAATEKQNLLDSFVNSEVEKTTRFCMQ